ncbi:MAG: prolipoprotein diacylglyceryl transferase [Acidobacteriota bacterium]|nr:prolipoprotein diacylglyceryl transferase [Acidobacteriota bacterium]MDE3044051.1 prolipoprotein diacylglyceryl transferase [Acidobacteriota bacterium]MDE3107696.1 prolipoprotein diacylglyceryl transferase [Acidobacteriota bacterium]
MSGFPTTFHLGPLAFHTYGLGLAIAAYVAYLYAERRLRRRAIDLRHFGAFTGVLLVAGLVGARAAHVATNWSLYASNPARIFALWQGGLASFGGIAVGLVAGIFAQRRWWPEVSLLRFADALVPALVAGWALGRVLGPQFMFQGGGHLTHQWFGLHYAGQVGKRVPVPLIQGAEDGTLWLLLVGLERRGWGQLVGFVTGVAMVIWGAVRALDERLLLGQNSHSGSVGVQLAGVALSVAGLVVLLTRRRARVETLTS